ncbi:High affinity methionine permease [Mycena kentingensis (nom. inval.)]|nr:High affinity methionine permease [Mycena kentingensis (nom. inval.)]
MSFLSRKKPEVDPVSPQESSDEKQCSSVEKDKGDEQDTVQVVEKLEVDAEGERGAELTFEEDVQGGMGRHLGVFSCTMLIVGRIIGTGIFSTPSSILSSVNSVGASLLLWVLGFVFSLCGQLIWLELGTMFPRSGGEKVYLEAVYRKPKYLATIVFAVNALVLGFTAAGCIVFAQSILIAAGQPATRWVVRGIGLGIIVFVTILHGFTPRLGIRLMNALSVFKIVILAMVVVTGWVVLSGKTHIQDPHVNFRDAFAGSSDSSNDYATAMFKVLFAYQGWSNINYVMNDVKDPVRTLKIAGPLGLGICATLYLFANIAYFSAASKEDILGAKVTVASLFFGNVFGEHAKKALSVFVALSAIGYVDLWPVWALLKRDASWWSLGYVFSLFGKDLADMGTEHDDCCTPFLGAFSGPLIVFKTYAAARVNQELAKEGVPIPGGSRFWGSNWPTGKSPMPGLILHLIPSIIVILGPPPDVAYPFILNVEGYPQQIVNFFIVIGLFWLRYHHPHIVRPFKVWLPLAVFFLAAAVFLLVAPFIRPANGVGDTPPLPYYLYCLVGIAIMVFGVLYWAAWRIVLPKMFGYRLSPRKEQLDDGTYVTLFDQKELE